MCAPLASSLVIAASALPASGQASEWGCTVLLCMAHPDGPEAVAQCVDPIRQLKRHLKRGHSFPSCEEANGSAEVRKVTSPYDACPTGLSALPDGALALAGENAPKNAGGVSYVMPAVGIGEGARFRTSGVGTLETTPPPAKVCVGQKVGRATYRIAGTGDLPLEVTTDIYDVVSLMPPAPLYGQSYDIYVNGQPYRRVRLGEDE
jgi:hypothetical protein